MIGYIMTKNKFFCSPNNNWLWVFQSIGPIFANDDLIRRANPTLQVFERLETDIPRLARSDVYDEDDEN